MNQKETNNDLSPEFKKELEKSKLEVLTNENDFLVKKILNDRRKKGFKKVFWKEKNNVCLWFYTTRF